MLDDFAPKETGKTAMLDKKKGAAHNIHASSLRREEDRVGLRCLKIQPAIIVDCWVVAGRHEPGREHYHGWRR
jgi:hypothetical protein